MVSNAPIILVSAKPKPRNRVTIALKKGIQNDNLYNITKNC